MLISFALILVIFPLLFILRRRRRKKPAQKKPVRSIQAPKSFQTKSEIVIVGSGILGSALAAVLARDGRRVTVVERDTSEPDRIVGELLQPGGCQALVSLGLQDAVLGIDACSTEGYVIHNSLEGSRVELLYPRNNQGEIIKGCAFHHGRFVMGLRKLARQEDRVTMVEGTVNALLEEDGRVVGVAYHKKGSEEVEYIKSKLTIVCDGCFSRFRRGLVNAPVQTYSHFVGVIMRDCPQYTKNHAELVLTRCGGPVLVYQIASSETRVLVDVRDPLPEDLSEYLLHVIAPQMPDHLRGPFVEAVTYERIRRMPACFLPPSPNPKSGVLTLGDAFNMRHPLTGGGMTVALKDVIIWRQLFKSCQDLSNDVEFQEKMQTFNIQRKSNHSFVVNILAQALYELFAATDEHLLQFREACFAYFKLGGSAVSGPIGLLSVVSPKPFVLLGHFFAVAFYAIYFAVVSVPLAQLPRGLYNGAAILLKACRIIYPLIWSEVRTLFNLH